jgi:internalin A
MKRRLPGFLPFRGSRGFVIEDQPEGRTLAVTGPWTPATEKALVARGIDRLDLNYARGYCEPDLGFLRAWPLRHLHVLDRTITDLTPVARMAETLRTLSFQVAPKTTFDVSSVPNIESLTAYWACLRGTIDRALNLTDLMVFDYDESYVVPLAQHESLQTLVLKNAPRLERLAGIESFPALRRLSILRALNLSDLDGVATTSTTLRRFDLEDCRVESLDAVGDLLNLTFLGVNDGGTIASLDPLRSLQQLEVLYAWGTTRIADGDLTPLLDLPRLREVRMRSRKQYQPSVAEIATKLANRQQDSPSSE